MPSNRKAIQKARWAIAVALMLWCAGAGCALVSYAHGAAMGNEEMASAQTDSSAWSGLTASAGVHSCCKARHSSQHAPATARPQAANAAEPTEVAVPESSNPANALSCCPLTSGAFVVTARRTVKDDRSSAAANNREAAFLVADVHSTAHAIPLRLPNQNQTYLRHCSFLI